MSSSYSDYFRLCREEKFFEAHEVLESLWLTTEGEEREFYQGLIQLAAVLVHFQRGNFPGARKIFETASCYLEPYPDPYLGVAIRKILGQFSRFLKVWSRHPSQPSVAKKFLPRIECIRKDER